jgi:hypothetical protein
VVFVLAINITSIAVASLGVFPSSQQGQAADFTFFQVEETDTGLKIKSKGTVTVAVTGVIVAGSVFTGVFISAALAMFASTFVVYHFSLFRGTLEMLGLSTSSGMGMILWVMSGISLIAALIYVLSGRRL